MLTPAMPGRSFNQKFSPAIECASVNTAHHLTHQDSSASGIAPHSLSHLGLGRFHRWTVAIDVLSRC